MTSPSCARDVMTSPVKFLDRGATVLEAAQFLLDNRLSGAPVADGGGRAVGVFTLRDLAKFFLDPALAAGGAAVALQGRVGDMMTKGVHSVRPEATLEDCRRAMRQHRIHRLLVQGPDGNMVGIISTSDLVMRA